jgi:hypothetical protein
VRKKPVSIEDFEPALEILAISNEFGVGGVPIGANGAESYSK